MTRAPALIVIAKEPRPGRVKTRLTPPCTPYEAAELAQAALGDTLAAATAVPASRRVLALDGRAGAWLPPSFEVISQSTGGLDDRLAEAIEAVGEPAVVIGMDTPQVTANLLATSMQALMRPGTDAVLGPAADGGYWAIGLRRPDGAAIAGVPMGVSWTAQAQRTRLDEMGLNRRELPELQDVDDCADARTVAAAWPRTRFARRWREVAARLEAPASAAGAG